MTLIHTIGHSTRTLDEFVALLRRHEVEHLADIRAHPGSRRYPHFGSDALAHSLPDLGIGYSHHPEHLGRIRAHPGSRRYPHFGSDALAHSLPDLGIGYSHHPELGGRRRGLADSPNGAWRNASFRAYADYMGTPAFATALDSLLDLAKEKNIAIMCAEAVPWRCHRWLVSDALVARGVDVHHIMDARSEPHSLTRFAELRDGKVVYPPESASTSHPDLFG